MTLEGISEIEVRLHLRTKREAGTKMRKGTNFSLLRDVALSHIVAEES